MSKKKPSKKDVAKKVTAEKKEKAQKKVAKALKPTAKPKSKAKPAGTPSPIKIRKEPSASEGFQLPEEVPPQLREQYRARFEEQQLADIGKEATADELERRRQDIASLGTPAEPAAIKDVGGPTSIPESERPLTPRPTPIPEPTPGEQAKKQQGRLPRGTSGTGIFTFQSTTKPPISGISDKKARDIAIDIARRQRQGFGISTLAPHVEATAIALARRDHDLAKSSNKEVNGIKPDDMVPTPITIRGTHHERLAEVIHGYGAKEEDFNKLPGKADLTTKVKLAWDVLKNNERSKRKTTLNPFSGGATHWQDPETKKVVSIEQGLPKGGFYRHEGPTESLVRAKGEANWKPLAQTVQGWEVVKLRSGKGKTQNTWVFRGHPAEPFKNTHQVRSLFQHIQSTLKGDFPEAPIRKETDSIDSRRRAAERVREKFIVAKPEPAEAGFFSRRAVKESGFLRGRGRTKRTFVASTPQRLTATTNPTEKTDNITIENTPEVEFFTGPKRIEPRRPKVVQEESGRRVVRPRRRDEGKKVGFVSQPLTISKQMNQKLDWETLKPKAESSTKIGPNGEILRSTPTIEDVIKLAPKRRLKDRTIVKPVLSKKITPGPVDRPLPGMEDYGYEMQATPEKKVTVKKLVPVEGPITAGQAEAEKISRGVPGIAEIAQVRGRPSIIVSEETIQKGTPYKPGSARPKPQGEFAGETGIEQLQYFKKEHGGVIPSSSRELVRVPKGTKAKKPKAPKAEEKTILSGTDLAAGRNVPQQLELPGFESPGYAGAMGQQFRRITPKTRELQLGAKQGAVPGVAAELPRGVQPKKSTRSFKGRR